MIRRLYAALPGRFAVRLVIMSEIVVVVLAGLITLYEWLGTTLLDSGGGMG